MSNKHANQGSRRAADWVIKIIRRLRRLTQIISLGYLLIRRWRGFLWAQRDPQIQSYPQITQITQIIYY
jgi:hypothetical protein